MAKKNSLGKTILNTLKNTFFIKDIPIKGTDTRTVVPTKATTKNGKTSFTPVNYPDPLKKMMDAWLHDVSDNPASLSNRLDRYKDLDYMYYNEGYIGQAVKLYADETTQYDSQTNLLTVTAKDRKTEKYITDFFERIGYTKERIQQIARSISLYGDAFCVNGIDEDSILGYTSSTFVGVRDIQDRIEFNPITVKKDLLKSKMYTDLTSKNSRLQGLAKALENDVNDKTQYFRSYLFGFQVDKDLFLPPWAVSHFRLDPGSSEFAPYGRPPLINCIGPYRQYKSAKNLMSLARISNFPKELFEIEVDETLDSTSRWDKVNDAKEQYHNLSNTTNRKEASTPITQVWTAKGLLNYSMIKPDLRLDDIADIEMLRDDVYSATGIPKGYINRDRGSFGVSGQALLQQFKPFGRAILRIQTAILEQLTQLVKLQIIITGDLPEDTEFELAMSFPNVEEASDRLRIKSDGIRLAKDIADSLMATLGMERGGKLPTSVVKDIFSQVSFLSRADVEEWIDEISKNGDKKEESSKWSERYNKETLKEVYLNIMKRNNMNEGLMQGKHFYSSWHTNPIDESILNIFKEEKQNKRLQEKRNKKIVRLNEAMAYLQHSFDVFSKPKKNSLIKTLRKEGVFTVDENINYKVDNTDINESAFYNCKQAIKENAYLILREGYIEQEGVWNKHYWLWDSKNDIDVEIYPMELNSLGRVGKFK